MSKNIDEIIKSRLEKKGKVTSEEVAGLAGISRQGAHKRLTAWVNRKRLIKVGRTRGSYYLPYTKEHLAKLQRCGRPIKKRFRNKELQEDLIFDQLAEEPLIINLSKRTKSILRYAFTEMFNNAIEHSGSLWIDVKIRRDNGSIAFEVIDKGIGVFNSIKQKYDLKDDFEALQELTKGKKTTAPKEHTGEGIFFTSKIADFMELSSSRLSLIFDNQAKEIFPEEIKFRKGTRVVFKINQNTKKDLSKLFGEYTDEEYKFFKTKVTVSLFEKGVDYVSRSQARRMLYDLDKFKTIELDFKGVAGIGQGFADEVFRVFSQEHPDIKIVPTNACQAVMFMIKRAQSEGRVALQLRGSVL